MTHLLPIWVTVLALALSISVVVFIYKRFRKNEFRKADKINDYLLDQLYLVEKTRHKFKGKIFNTFRNKDARARMSALDSLKNVEDDTLALLKINTRRISV